MPKHEISHLRPISKYYLHGLVEFLVRPVNDDTLSGATVLAEIRLASFVCLNSSLIKVVPELQYSNCDIAGEKVTATWGFTSGRRNKRYRFRGERFYGETWIKAVERAWTWRDAAMNDYVSAFEARNNEYRKNILQCAGLGEMEETLKYMRPDHKDLGDWPGGEVRTMFNSCETEKGKK